VARHPLGTLFRRSPTREQTLMEVLARDGEPLVASWASAHRRRVRDPEDLLQALERLRAEDRPQARALAATIWLTWRAVTLGP
jgi:hypothetical protein